MKKLLSVLLLTFVIIFGACFTHASADGYSSYWSSDSYLLPVWDVSASAYYEKYAPTNILNDNEETAWQYSARDTGDGYRASITLQLSTPSTVEALVVKNGFWKVTDGLDQYWRNCRAREVTLSFRYANESGFGDERYYEFHDEKELVVIDVGVREDVTGIRFQVESVYEGERFKNDVAVTYIGVVGYDNHGGESWGSPPATSYWQPIPASLNRQMSTRTGPGTKYTETHGTLPEDTEIVLFRQAMGSGVPWGMVEFQTSGGALIRAYTGMKRIDASETPLWEPTEPKHAVVSYNTRAFFGPGSNYMIAEQDVPAGFNVSVWGEENGWSLIEYVYEHDSKGKEVFTRVWVPTDMLSYYSSNG